MSEKSYILSKKILNFHKKWKGKRFSSVFVHKIKHKYTAAVVRGAHGGAQDLHAWICLYTKFEVLLLLRLNFLGHKNW